MNWSKIKTVLIFLFLLINVFLLTWNIMQRREGKSISDDTVKSTIQILKNGGVTLSDSLIDREVPNMSRMVVSNASGNEPEFLAAILGESYIKEENHFYSGNKSVDIKGSHFVITERRETDTIESAREWLSDNGIELSGTVQTEYNGRYVFKSVYDGYEIFGSKLDVSCDGEYTKAEGSLVYVKKDEGTIPCEMRHVTSVLPRLISDGCNNCVIESVSAGYMSNSGEGNFAEANAGPYYRIVASDGIEYYYNAAK